MNGPDLMILAGLLILAAAATGFLVWLVHQL